MQGVVMLIRYIVDQLLLVLYYIKIKMLLVREPLLACFTGVHQVGISIRCAWRVAM